MIESPLVIYAVWVRPGLVSTARITAKLLPSGVVKPVLRSESIPIRLIDILIMLLVWRGWWRAYIFRCIYFRSFAKPAFFIVSRAIRFRVLSIPAGVFGIKIDVAKIIHKYPPKSQY